MAISAISGFSPALSLIGSLSPLRQVSLLQPTSGINSLGSLLSIASTQASFSSISSLGRLLNDVETLQTAAAALAVPGVFVARSVSASNATTATATASAATPTGSYALQVDQLAQAQTLTTAAQASSLSTIGSGGATTLSFAFAGGTSRSVTLGSTGNTLAGIASAINAAGIGITATLATSSSGVRLSLTGQTGAANAFSIEVSGDAAVADALAFPAGGSGGPTLTVTAQDAQGEVNGIAFSASTNSVNTAVAGLSLNLLGTGAATLTVAANSDAAKAVRSFVDAFNEVRSGFAELAGASPVLGLTASFLGAQLTAALNTAGGSAGTSSLTLTQIGITSGIDGTLAFNEAAFQTALNTNQAGVATLFRNGGKGIAEQVAAQAAGPLSPAQLLPLLTPALSFQGSFGTSSASGLLLSLFGSGSTLGSTGLSSSLANELLFAQLLGASQTGSGQSSNSLADLLFAELLFANQL
ncbi:MAG: flagellar filament capping protein FliD [Rhodocyclales bacterium]|nr:flagellar filament capping protein FliD [Rhodocyclales bacterium]